VSAFWMTRADGADSEGKHEPVSDIDTAVVKSLKALDPERPIREADIRHPHAASCHSWPVLFRRCSPTGNSCCHFSLDGSAGRGAILEGVLPRKA
jgi:hypothetical protein